MNRSITILYLLHILNDGYRTAIVTMLPFVAKELSLSLTSVGILGSSQTFIGTFLAIPAGYLAAKFGGFRLLIFSLFLYSLGFVGVSLSPHFLVLLVAFYTSAIGFAFFHPVSFVLVARLAPKHSRGKTMGNFMSLGDIGRMIIPTITLLCIPIVGWRLVIFVCAVVGFGLYILSWMIIRNAVAHDLVGRTMQSGKRIWLANALLLLKEKQFRTALFAAAMDTLASSSIYVFLTFLLLQRGVDAAHLVLFTSAFFVGSLLGKFLLGRAVDRFGNRKVFILSEWAMAITLLILVSTSQFVVLLITACILGVFTKGTSPVIQTLISKTIHESHYEKAFGASETFIQIAGALSIFISGVVADHFGISAVFYLAALFAILATFPLFRFQTTTADD